MTQLTWLITGCSSGFGEELVKAILKRGDNAIATGRGSVDRLKALHDLGAATMELDVTSDQETLNKAIQKALTFYGDIDVLVNNAGYIEACLLEDVSQERLIRNMNTNLFGAINLARAVLPTFRKKRAGVIVWNGSCGGWQGEVGAGPYCATKFAMEGVVECLQKETVSFGIQNILFEPGFYRTKVYSQPNLVFEALQVPEYTDIQKALEAGVAAVDGTQPGDPAKAAERMIDMVRQEGMAAGKEIPLRLPLGRDGMEQVRNKCIETLKIIEDWEELIVSTDFDAQ